MRDAFAQRVIGSLAGVAIGDAMGMPCEFLTREQIQQRYGRLASFVSPDPGHYHKGLKRGQITDDTEQTIEVIRALVRHGRLTPETAADAYLKWARDYNAFESTVLGPSSRKALERLIRGEDPRVTGEHGDTVGAAMRVAPIGLVNAGRLQDAADECYASCLPTHGVSIAIGGACAIACAVAAAAAADTLDEVIDAAIWGASYGEALGVKWAGASVAARIRLALRIVRETPDVMRAEDELYLTCGVGMAPTELVPTAIGIVALHDGDCAKSIESAVNMGGDTDTLASMVGAITGAYRGIDALPEEWIRLVQDINDLDLRDLADQLVLVREGRLNHGRS